MIAMDGYKVAAVREWVNSEEAIHIMRDHPHVRKSSVNKGKLRCSSSVDETIFIYQFSTKQL